MKTKRLIVLSIAILSLFLLISACARAGTESQPAAAQAVGASTDPVQLVKEGKALLNSGDIDAAEKKLLEAVALAEPQKNATALQFGYTFLGKLYAAKGDRQSAIDSYEKSALAFEGNQKMLAAIHLTLGDLCLDAGNNTDAIGHYRKSLENFTAIGDTGRAASINNSIALAYTAAGDFKSAEDIYKSLLADAQAQGNATQSVSILMNTGNLHRTTADFDAAISDYTAALDIAVKNNRAADAVIALNGIALVHEYRGEADKAEAALERAAKTAAEGGDRPGLAATLHQGGILQLYKGNPSQAIDDFKKSAEIKEQTGDGTLANTLAEIGRAYYFMGNYKQARRYYNDATKLNPSADTGITIDNNLAMVYKMQGMPEYALETFKGALDKSRRFNLRYQTSFLLNNIGVVQRESGDLDEALKNHEAALEIDKALGAAQDVIVDQNNIALVYKLKGDYEKALEMLLPALEDARKTASFDDLLRTLINLADVYLLKDSPDDALKYYLEAADFADKTMAAERRWNALFGAGRALEKKGDTDNAAESYKKAVDVIENIRANIGGGDDDKGSFLDDKVKVYVRLIQLLFRQQKFDEALDYLERMKARTLLEMIQRGKGKIDKGMTAEEIEKEKNLKAELTQATQKLARAMAKGPDSADSRAAKDALNKSKKENDDFKEILYRTHPGLAFARGESAPVKTGELRKYLEADEVLVAYMLGDDTSYAWTITRDAVKMYDLGETGEKIGFLVITKLREGLEKGVWQSAQERAAAKLYKTVVEPIEPDLAGKSVMGVMPDGRLYEIPFYLMMDGEKKFLIDKIAVFYLPSLSVMVENRKALSALKNDGKVLAFGNPTFAREDLVQLPGTESEVGKISEIYGANANVYIHDTAIEERLKLFGRGFRIVHLATHGLLNNNNPMFSSIAMCQITDQKDDGYLEAREISNIQLDAELVIMSACDSGRGKLKPGEGILGLTRSFFSAGVPGIVASLWQVNDQATSFMMQRFYEFIKTERAVDALRHAQIATKKEFGDNPNLWAPFIIMGYGVDGKGAEGR